MEFDRSIRTAAVLGCSVSVLDLSSPPLKHSSPKVFGRAWWPWGGKAMGPSREQEYLACFHSGGICVWLVRRVKSQMAKFAAAVDIPKAEYQMQMW